MKTIQRIRGYFYNEMRYINLRFTYLLTYLFVQTVKTAKINSYAVMWSNYAEVQ